MSFGGTLPTPCKRPGVFWEHIFEEDDDGEPGTEPTTFLRPDWDRPWTENQRGWSYKTATRIQQRGHEYSSSLTKERLATTARDTIVDAIAVVFASMVKRWKLESGGKVGEAAKKKRNEYAKISGRKRTVSPGRGTTILHLPPLLTESGEPHEGAPPRPRGCRSRMGLSISVALSVV